MKPRLEILEDRTAPSGLDLSGVDQAQYASAAGPVIAALQQDFVAFEATAQTTITALGNVWQQIAPNLTPAQNLDLLGRWDAIQRSQAEVQALGSVIVNVAQMPLPQLLQAAPLMVTFADNLGATIPHS